MSDINLIRVNKYLAHRGFCSRREADEWIVKGWVFVNGIKVEKPGLMIDPASAEVAVDDAAKYIVKHTFLLNKPTGYLSTVTEKEGKSLLRLLPEIEGLFPIGRLDKESEGLILVTNDRTLTKRIIGEVKKVEKEYRVELNAPLPSGARKKLEQGIVLFEKKLKPCRIVMITPTTLMITLTEGKNRQIRRIFQKVGNHVVALERIRIGSLSIGSLKPGEHRVVSRKELSQF
jgi:23S rRNA pseudouridine2604 synthase